MKKLWLVAVLCLFAVQAVVAIDSTQTVVSDTSNIVVGGGHAVATWVHPAWTSIPGATWIWSSYYVTATSARNGETTTFFKEFKIESCGITAATLTIAADNTFTVWVNGVQVAQDTTGTTYSAARSFDVTKALHVGQNVIRIQVTNLPWNTDDPTVNPAGLLYSLSITKDLDADHDGVCDSKDLCPGTVKDKPGDLLTHSWFFNDHDWVMRGYEDKREGHHDDDDRYSIQTLRGCSCAQILTYLNSDEKRCTKDILDEFLALQKPPVDTVTVDSASTTGGDSNIVLTAGKKYVLVASGTWANQGASPPDLADAEYISEDNWATYMNGDPTWASQYGILDYADELDLQVANNFVDWGAYSPTHTYLLTYLGAGSPVNFRVFDGQPPTLIPGWYGDNAESLTVKIYQE